MFMGRSAVRRGENRAADLDRGTSLAARWGPLVGRGIIPSQSGESRSCRLVQRDELGGSLVNESAPFLSMPSVLMTNWHNAVALSGAGPRSSGDS